MPQKFGIVMLATKFYAASDMGGGLEQSAHRLFQYLLAAGHRVYVLTRNYDGLSAQEVIEGVMVHRFPFWGASPAMASFSYLVKCMVWMIAHRHEYQVIHCHQSYAPATIGALAGLLLRKPVLVKISTSDEFSERRELERLPLFRLRRFLLRRVDRFVVVNRRAREEFAGLGIDLTRIVHIPNGVPIPTERAFDVLARRAARKRKELPWERIVLYVGRLASEKNVATLIDAWPTVLRAHPDAHLLLVGDGGTFRSVEADLRRQVVALGLETSVHFVGRVPDARDFLLAADAFVLPSTTEGMSNALLEAMAIGLPIVATRIPGNAALIEDGESGMLVEKGNVRELGNALTEVLASPQIASRLGRAARGTAARRFALDRVGEQYAALYAELLGGQS